MKPILMDPAWSRMPSAAAFIRAEVALARSLSGLCVLCAAPVDEEGKCSIKCEEE